MHHPFLALDLRQRNSLFWVSFAATMMVMVVMGIIGEPLVTPQAPLGIVSFELAGTPSQVGLILDSWDGRAKQYAAFGLGLDYLYLLAYSTAVGLGCLLAGVAIRSAAWPLASLGIPLTWGVWTAAVFDAIENLGLTLILLAGITANTWPAIVRLCALLKFGLLFLGLVYVFYGLVVGLVGRLKR